MKETTYLKKIPKMNAVAFFALNPYLLYTSKVLTNRCCSEEKFLHELLPGLISSLSIVFF